MADSGPSAETGEEENQLNFHVKSSSDAKFNITMPASATVLDLKNKLSTAEYADLPTDRQRLIYSGKVLRDTETLGSYNIKNGNTLHLVKGAASNQRNNAANQNTSSVAGSNSGAQAAAGVPTNLAAGTANNPLAALTGARYAGFHPLPGADMFGPDGGMGPPPDQESLLRMMENPMFLSQMNEAMNNPAVIQMMRDNPMIRDNPMARAMLDNPGLRQMMVNPELIRAQMQFSRAIGGGPGAGGESFPAPGVTNNTSIDQGENATQGSDSTGNAATGTNNQPGNNPLPNPFANPNIIGGAAGGDANPFAQLLSGMGIPAANNPTMSPPSSNAPNNQETSSQPQQQQGNNPPPNPLASLFSGMQPTPGDPNQAADSNSGSNPMGQMMLQMSQLLSQNPNLSNNPAELANMFGAGGAGAAGMGGLPGLAGLAGMGGMPGMPQQQPQQPPDNRPPEERYADQLRQLNDMGFFEFERNVTALRRSGGSVQGAVEYLLSGS